MGSDASGSLLPTQVLGMAGNDASSVPAALASTPMVGEISLKERLMRLSGWRHLYSGFTVALSSAPRVAACSTS
jgi:hypothetical protein